MKSLSGHHIRFILAMASLLALVACTPAATPTLPPTSTPTAMSEPMARMGDTLAVVGKSQFDLTLLYWQERDSVVPGRYVGGYYTFTAPSGMKFVILRYRVTNKNPSTEYPPFLFDVDMVQVADGDSRVFHKGGILTTADGSTYRFWSATKGIHTEGYNVRPATAEEMQDLGPVSELQSLVPGESAIGEVQFEVPQFAVASKIWIRKLPVEISLDSPPLLSKTQVAELMQRRAAVAARVELASVIGSPIVVLLLTVAAIAAVGRVRWRRSRPLPQPVEKQPQRLNPWVPFAVAGLAGPICYVGLYAAGLFIWGVVTNAETRGDWPDIGTILTQLVAAAIAVAAGVWIYNHVHPIVHLLRKVRVVTWMVVDACVALVSMAISSRGLLMLGVVIVTLSVFGFVQSSSELEEIRASYGRSVYRIPEWDMQQLFRSLSVAGLVVGVSMVAAGLFLLTRRPSHTSNPREGE